MLLTIDKDLSAEYSISTASTRQYTLMQEAHPSRHKLVNLLALPYLRYPSRMRSIPSQEVELLDTGPHSKDLSLAFTPYDGLHAEAHTLKAATKPFHIFCTFFALACQALHYFVV